MRWRHDWWRFWVATIPSEGFTRGSVAVTATIAGREWTLGVRLRDNTSPLVDLRAYFTRGKRKACLAERPQAGPALGYTCTLPTRHDGKHVAHDIDGTLICAWSEPATPPEVVDRG